MTDFATRRRFMVDTQVRTADVTEFPIIDAMLNIPREVFVPRDRIEAAYSSEPVALGDDRVVLDPRCFAKMLEALDITNDDLVLDVGAGLGYSSAVIARIAEAVVALEDDPARVSEAQGLLSEHDADNVILVEGALTEGCAQHGPYDAIVVEGGIETLPAVFVEQLKERGRIACLFMEGPLGTAKIGYKVDGRLNWRSVFNAGAPVLDGFRKETSFAL